ncbi:MAG: hypothetical protein PHO91_04085 [Patescibacteria group bacterium]|nr:hypothetical protein [Patescibacteria group bacterium]
MGFWQKVLGRNSQDRQIIKEPEHELMKKAPDELMIREEKNHNIEKDQTLNNKGSP